MEEPNLKIKTVGIDTLEYDPFNVREHDERNIEAIKASLARFGQQKPIVVKKDGTVIAGNGTLGAMRMLGFNEVVIAETELDGEEAVAFAIADNRTAELASWNLEDLATRLKELAEDDKGLFDATGFNAQELASMASADYFDDVVESLAENEDSEAEKKYVVVVDFTAEDYHKAKTLWEYHIKNSDDPSQILLEILA